MHVEEGHGPVVVLGEQRLRTQLLADACRRRGVETSVLRTGSALTDAGARAVLVDLSLEIDEDTIATLAELADAGTPVLALVDRATPAADRPQLGVAIDGYIHVDSDPDELVAALRDGSGLTAPVADAPTDGLTSLTSREHEVLTELLTGDGTTDIGDRLGISEHTVRSHVQNVLSKLDVHSRAEAASAALRAGLQPPQRAGTA